MKERADTVRSISRRILRLNYLINVPETTRTEPDKKWPLILFLHGAGERGSDLRLLTQNGIPRRVEEEPAFPFITISPQCPETIWWTNLIEELDVLYNQAIERYPVDTERVYLTGMSMGGYGSWAWASLYPDRFAALAPVCGGGSSIFGFPEKVCVLRDLPIWVFHGALDEVVPLAESEMLVNTLMECGGKVRFTIYPDRGHDSWTPTYANPELYAWFLEQRCSER